MFLGSYIPSFDLNARRLALPKKIRDYLATSEIILSIGFEKCLFGFDTKGWNRQARKQLDKSITDRRARDLRRFLFSSATTVKLDDQGRCVIPSNLLEHAKIKSPIVVGAGDHFEIWDKEAWQKERLRIDKEIG